MPDVVLAPSFPEKLISKYVDLWQPYDFSGVFGSYPAQRSFIEAVFANKLQTLLLIDTSLGTRPGHFDMNVEADLLDIPRIPDSQPGHMRAYFESQLYFILAKHSFVKNRNLYSKDQLQKDINDFYDATSDSVVMTFLYNVDWFNQYKNDKVNFVNAADVFIRTSWMTVVTLLNTYNDFNGVDDIFMLLSVKGDTTLKRIFGASLADPSDDALVFRADDIISDSRFASAAKKSFSSYAVLNTLKKVSRINIDSFYNFYASDESITSVGDSVANSANYYDLAAAYKFMPRYNKLVWGPVDGGSGINTAIVSVSGNISNISELQILNEFYVSQTFRKQGNGSDYVVINSSSEGKFEASPFWSKILSGLENKETKDLVDNKIFIVDHSLLRKRSDEQPRLQYVGYIINKYELTDRWRLKEVIMLDDCSTSTYYDFNVLYNRKYKYKISTLLKWVYSTSLAEVESFYSAATFINELGVSTMPEVSILRPSVGRPSSLESTSIEGLSVMGSAEQFEGRTAEIAGEIARADEESRLETADSSLSSVVTSVGISLAGMLSGGRV